MINRYEIPNNLNLLFNKKGDIDEVSLIEQRMYGEIGEDFMDSFMNIVCP